MSKSACDDLETRIPALVGVMANHGWGRGSMLLHRWLHLGANDKPKHGVHDLNTVRMDWVLIYGRALSAYRAAKENRIWVNEKAQEVIIGKLIERKGVRLPEKVGDRVDIGNIGEGQPRNPGNVLGFHNDWQVQYKEVAQSKFTSPMDDLYAALGDFSFYFLVKGFVERLEDQSGQPRYRVTVNKVGAYVMDSYDFNDTHAKETMRGRALSWLASKPFTNVGASQPLGIWGCQPPYVGKEPGINRHYVNNYDFREWRRKYGKGRGGDFLVFSDIKVFDTDDSFEF